MKMEQSVNVFHNGMDKMRQEIKNVRIITLFTCLGFFLKQFYLSSSGSVQLGDIFLLLGFVLFICYNGHAIYTIDVPIIAFLCGVFFINLIYFINYSETSFLMKTLFMAYNIVIACILYRKIILSEYFLKWMCITLKAVLVCQLIMYFAGIGKWLFSNTRYVGTFNDPNQFAFYVISSLLGIYIISNIVGKKANIIWVILALFEIILSASSGVLIGLFVFGIGYLFYIGEGSTRKKTIIITIYILICAFLLINFKTILEIIMQSNNFAIRRIVARVFSENSSSGSFLSSFMADRGLTKAFENPKYFIFGSGDGLWTRFSTTSSSELHSTIISIAFCYGVIPFALFVIWMKRNLWNLRFVYLFAYIALMLECFTLLNHRQPIFWFLIILANHPNCKKIQKEIDESVG